MGTSLFSRDVIDASIRSERTIPLGIRAAVSGSSSFCQRMSRILAADSDVASVLVVDHTNRHEEMCGIHLLIADSGAGLRHIGGIEHVGLVAVIGESLASYETLSNTEYFPIRESDEPRHTFKMIKEKTVARRLREFASLLGALVGESETEPKETADDLLIQADGIDRRVSISSIEWIRAAGSHVEIRAGGNSYVHRSRMHSIERALPNSFVRIHRRVIVNLRKAISIDRDNIVRQIVRFADGTQFFISRHRRSEVEERVKAIRGCAA